MGALEGFLSTWDKARQTFGAGVPQTGEQFDQSAQLQQLQSTVQTAAPGSAWSGTAANAYGEVNKEHARVLGELAVLDRRLANHVNESANVVATGRQNLDNLRQWVVDAAASVPPGKNREQLILPIVQKGLGELSGIVSTSNSGLNRVAGDITKLGTEWDALQDQKFGGAGKEDKPEQRDDEVQLVSNEEPLAEDGDLKPEDMEELVHQAVQEGNPEAAAKVDKILDSINENQLGPHSKENPLTPVQAELVGQMQAQMKPMSLADLNAARERLGDNKNILINAMHVMSDPDVTYPRHDGDGAQIVPSGPGVPLPNNGVLPGDTGALPDGVQAVLNERGNFLGPPDPSVGYPGSQTDLEAPQREAAANNMKNLADIVGEGDPRFQQGSQLDREMMANAKEWLAAQEGPTGQTQEHWGDEVVERVFDTAGRDTVVSHDMLTTDRDFMQDVLTHEWQDDGQSARTLTDWIHDSSTSPDPDVRERAGQTASAIASYIGDPKNENILMNNSTGSQPNMSLGQMNPELTTSLANAISPYMDEMAGRPISSEGTTGWNSIDNSSDLSYPHAVHVMGVLGTGEDAARILDSRSAEVQAAYINEYANSVIDSHGQLSDSSAMEAAGRLKGITAEGAFMSTSDIESDATKARQAAWDRMARNYDAFAALAGGVPHAGPALGVESVLMKDAILGPRPESANLGETPIESTVGVKSALATAFMMNGIGDPADIARLSPFDSDGDGQLNIPSDDVYDESAGRYQNALNIYFSNLSDSISDPLDDYDRAYRDVVR